MSRDGVGHLIRIDGNMDAKYYVNEILQKHVKQSAKELKLGRKWIFQQDNDPKVRVQFLTFSQLILTCIFSICSIRQSSHKIGSRRTKSKSLSGQL